MFIRGCSTLGKCLRSSVSNISNTVPHGPREHWINNIRWTCALNRGFATTPSSTTTKGEVMKCGDGLSVALSIIWIERWTLCVVRYLIVWHLQVLQKLKPHKFYRNYFHKRPVRWTNRQKLKRNAKKKRRKRNNRTHGNEWKLGKWRRSGCGMIGWTKGNELVQRVLETYPRPRSLTRVHFVLNQWRVITLILLSLSLSLSAS